MAQKHPGFLCNICGADCAAAGAPMQRESSSCDTCGSSARARSIVRVLSLCLFGKNLILPDFPVKRDLRGLGMSDWEGYAVTLAEKFAYTNTYYHKEPKLDISDRDIPKHLIGGHDFIISSEVFEHVIPPVRRAFENTFKMLKPGGWLILTVPFGIQSKTIEHFPDLDDFTVIEDDGKYRLRNVTRSGTVQEFHNLVFHGGPGATLEMRVFAKASLLKELAETGFEDITVHREPDHAHGISWPERWSYPISAQRPLVEENQSRGGRTRAPSKTRNEAMEDKQFLIKPSRAANSKQLDRFKWVPRSLTEICLVAFVVLVISLHIKYLWSVRTGVPHQDEWSLLADMFQAADGRQVGVWMLQPRNGHFLVPGTLAYLMSWRLFSLDLTALRLFNFPICLAAFCLTAHVINVGVQSRFLRFYLYLGACFIIFNLCLWEHFAQAYGFTAILSALLGGIGLYYAAKVTQLSSKWKSQLLAGLIFLIASVLSFGAGYAAVAAAVSLGALCYFKTLKGWTPKYAIAARYAGYAVVLLVILSHPFFQLKSRITQTVLHSVLVAGSIASTIVDQKSLLAQDIAFVFGSILVVTSLFVSRDFLNRRSAAVQVLPIFSFGLVLFGISACAAVAVARWYFPEAAFLYPRYTLYPSICLLGALLYFARGHTFWRTNVWCLAAAGYLIATIKEFHVAPFRPVVYRKISAAMRNIDNLSDEDVRGALYWRENTKGVRRVVARMRRDRLNVFRDAQ